MGRFWRVDKALEASEGLGWVREWLGAYNWSTKVDWVTVRRGRSERYAFRGVYKAARQFQRDVEHRALPKIVRPRYTSPKPRGSVRDLRRRLPVARVYIASLRGTAPPPTITTLVQQLKMSPVLWNYRTYVRRRACRAKGTPISCYRLVLRAELVALSINDNRILHQVRSVEGGNLRLFSHSHPCLHDGGITCAPCPRARAGRRRDPEAW